MEGRFGAAVLRSTRKLLVVGAAAASFALSAGSATAVNCPTNLTGIAHSGGRAGNAQTIVCAPAYGHSAGSGVGRKVG
jgi:hypothetical protein